MHNGYHVFAFGLWDGAARYGFGVKAEEGLFDRNECMWWVVAWAVVAMVLHRIHLRSLLR